MIEADATALERTNSEEEFAASQFAGDILLEGRAEEIAQASVDQARGSVERLKGVVPDVARRFGVDTGALANYLAPPLMAEHQLVGCRGQPPAR